MKLLDQRLILLALSILTLIERIDAEDNVDVNSDLEEVEIRTVVNRRIKDGKIVRLTERYSASQKRGLIEFKFDSIYMQNNYLTDLKNNYTLQYNQNKCSLSSPDELAKSLGLQEIESDLGVPEHIVGPTKWLAYVRQNRAKLKISDLASNTVQTIRNINCVKYETEYRSKKGSNLTLHVFFADRDLANQQQKAIPILIGFLSGKKQVASLEFFTPEQLVDRRIKPNTMRIGVEHDTLSIRFPTSCAELLATNSGISSLKLLTNDNKVPVRDSKFSFQAKVEHVGVKQLPRSFSSFVAYDPRLEMMRIDREWVEDEMESRMIIDFKTNLRYHLLSEHDGKDLTHCKVTSAGRLLDSRLSTMDLLMGTSSAKPIGRAKVRGIDTNVYQALNTSLPYWLEQPIEYQNVGEDGSKILNPVDMIKSSTQAAVRLVTVIYMSDTVPTKPMMLELYRTDENMMVTFDLRTINFYNFDWRLQSYSPDGNSPLDLFSLATVCTSDEESEDNNEADMLLESDDQSGSVVSKLKAISNFDRELALVASMRERWGLVVPMISDLRLEITEQIVNPLSLNKTTKAKIGVNFKLADHPTTIMNLIKIGKGSLILGRSKMRIVNSLFQCFMLASQQGSGTYFGYKVLERFCYIGVPTLSPIDGSTILYSMPFNLKPDDGNIEIFKADEVLNNNLVDANWWAKSHLFIGTILQQRGKKLEISLTPSESPLELKVVNFLSGAIHGKGAKNHHAYYNSKTRIDGIGFVENEFTRRALSATTETQCRAACNANAKCQSYSFCIRGSISTCIISVISLNSMEAVDSIRDLANKTENSKTFQFQMNDDDNNSKIKVEFTKRLTCTTYNRRYLDYFSESKVHMHEGQKGIFMIPADEEEQCAEFCVRYNIEKYSMMQDTLTKSLHMIEDALSKEAFSHPKEAWDMLNSRKSQNQEPDDVFCHGFRYIEEDQLLMRLSDERIDELRQLSLKSIEYEQKEEPFSTGVMHHVNPKLEGSDYCMIQTPLSKLNHDQFKNFSFGGLIVPERQYRFMHFFEASNGISLRKSKLNNRQSTVLEKISTSDSEINQDELRIVQEIMSSTTNNQLEIKLSRGQCARICVFQTYGPWPACKSFDFIIEKVTGSEDSFRFMCRLNSITLAEAKASGRYELIDDRASSNDFEHWHYEPQLGLGEMSAISGDETILEAILRKALKSHDSFKWLGYSLFALFGLMSGAFLGLHIGNNYIMPRLAEIRRFRSTSQTHIIDLPDTIPTG